MLQMEKKKVTLVRSFRLNVEAYAVLADLAKIYKTTQVKMLEALLLQQGSRLLDQAQRRRTPVNAQ